MSSVVAIGVSHHSAPLALLEALSVERELVGKHLDDLLAREHISEAVLISTCHRTEVFVVAEKFHGAFKDVRDAFSDLSFLPPERFIDHLSVTYDADAARHLFELAAGVDSVVIGEHEILGQVRDAWEDARAWGSSGPVLNQLFRHAIEVGKRVRTDTAISRSVASVAHAAVIMLDEQIEAWSDQRVVVVGAGSMSRGVAKFIAERSPGSLVVLNRTIERAQELCDEIGARAEALAELDSELAAADVVVCATSSPQLVITTDQVVQATADARRLTLVDLSVPRNVAPEVALLDSVALLGMDELRQFAERGLSERRAELPAVQCIIDEELDRYRSASSARSVAPLITGLRQRADELIALETARFEVRLGGLSPEDRETAEQLVRGVVAKLLHEPTVRLKDSAGTLRGERLVGSLRELFDL